MDDLKTAFVTGATNGIGKAIASGLAKQGLRVIVGARDADKGKAVRDELAAATGNANITVAKVDVASRASIAALDLGVPRLDILVNNAGVWYTDRTLSPDGIELVFATNVLGPHRVTKRVMPLLEAAPAARVVNVVSAFSKHLDLTDLEFARRKYDGFKCYSQSKQALRMLTWGLASRFAGTKLTANAVSPGFVKTGFNTNTHGFLSVVLGLSSKLFAVSPENGAATPIWVATSRELDGVSGKYFDAMKEKDGKFREPEAIAELERLCDAYDAKPAAVRAV